MSPAVAVAGSRWRFEAEELTGRWWYTIVVEGGRRARYEVSILHVDGRRPVPFKVCRCGRTTRGIGRSQPEIRQSVERVAVEAIQTEVRS